MQTRPASPEIRAVKEDSSLGPGKFPSWGHVHSHSARRGTRNPRGRIPTDEVATNTPGSQPQAQGEQAAVLRASLQPTQSPGSRKTLSSDEMPGRCRGRPTAGISESGRLPAGGDKPAGALGGQGAPFSPMLGGAGSPASVFHKHGATPALSRSQLRTREACGFSSTGRHLPEVSPHVRFLHKANGHGEKREV